MKTTKQKGAGFDPETLEREEQELQGMAHHAAPEWEVQRMQISWLAYLKAVSTLLKHKRNS